MSGSCSYFILEKTKFKNISDDSENKIITIDSNNNDNNNPRKNIYILPYNNIDYYRNYGLFEKKNRKKIK